MASFGFLWANLNKQEAQSEGLGAQRWFSAKGMQMSHGLGFLGGAGGVTRQTLDQMKLQGQRSRESEGGRAERMREASLPPLPDGFC